jgi:hypothetical protein
MIVIGIGEDGDKEVLHFTLGTESYFGFPDEHRNTIRNTNLIERVIREVRRRTKAMDSLDNEYAPTGHGSCRLTSRISDPAPVTPGMHLRRYRGVRCIQFVGHCGSVLRSALMVLI